MGRFWAATRVVALFLIALFASVTRASPIAHACEACERVPLAPAQSSDTPRHPGRVDVTTAVDAATSFIAEKTLRGWRWISHLGMSRGDVDVAQLEDEREVADISNGSDVIATAVDSLAPRFVDDTASSVRMPDFRREHKWALTYRSDAADANSQPPQSDRFPGMNTTLDDSAVVGLRFEWDYGWTR